jgi:tetratricopeptide (TPR) repeat protein
MRGLKVIGLFCVLVFLAACTSCHNDPVETRLIASPTTIASSELISIDSLMWQQPDSALMRLLPCFDTCCRDGVHTVSTAYNCHYAHLLLAELLYKNDCAQTNRAELQQAVSYFDSLVRQAFPPFKGVPEGRGIHTNNSNDILSFLDARAHYINGVGYYENDSAVEACAEYIKALEIMDERFGEKELVGKKAKFMAYTNNRLGDLFSEQFMMEPAIACYKNSYEYSLVSPVSSYSVSNALYHMGLQFNMKGEKDSANYYYSQALANMPDSTNPYYRDIVSTQYLLLYQLTHQTEASLKRLKQMVALTEDDDERLTRYLAIGDIYFEEGFYDSACFYLEPVLKNNDNSFLQIQVANYLRIIYDSLGNKEKSDWCKLYLALHNETGAENSALVSQLSDLFKTYMSQRQEKEAEAKREAAVKKVLKVIIPIAVVLALAIIVTAKWRSKKLLKAKEERHQQEMETERQAHKMQQAALSGRLKRSNEELRDVSKQLEQSLSKNTFESEASNDYAAFINAPICLYIVELAHKSQFKSKMDYLIYKDDALSKEQILALRDAAEKHLARFVSLIRKQFPKLTDSDMDYCYLFLLGLSEADISALMQRAYTTVCDRSRKINRIVGADDSLYHTLHNML